MNACQRLDFVGENYARRDTDLAFAMTWLFNGEGIDLTGHVLEVKLRRQDGSGDPYLTIDNDTNGGVTLADQTVPTSQGGTRGKAWYVIRQAQAAALAPGVYFWTARDLSSGSFTPMWIGFVEFRGPTS